MLQIKTKPKVDKARVASRGFFLLFFKYSSQLISNLIVFVADWLTHVLIVCLSGIPPSISLLQKDKADRTIIMQELSSLFAILKLVVYRKEDQRRR